MHIKQFIIESQVFWTKLYKSSFIGTSKTNTDLSIEISSFFEMAMHKEYLSVSGSNVQGK